MNIKRKFRSYPAEWKPCMEPCRPAVPRSHGPMAAAPRSHGRTPARRELAKQLLATKEATVASFGTIARRRKTVLWVHLLAKSGRPEPRKTNPTRGNTIIGKTPIY